MSRRPSSSGPSPRSSSSSTQFRNQQQHAHPPSPPPPRDIVILLVNAGLWIGKDGLVDAFDRGMSTTANVSNESVVHARPDIVHQCLLGIFDSELGSSGRVRVFISTTKGKTIEVSPALRPPRTYERFKGLMATLLRDGKIVPSATSSSSSNDQTQQQRGNIRYQQAVQQQPLLQILQGSIAPIIPEGAEVIGVTNAKYASISTPTAVAKHCLEHPVSQQLRGGRKGAMAFFCIDCRDEGDSAEEPSVTKLVSLSPYPQSPHVQAIRLCEGFHFTTQQKLQQKNVTAGKNADNSGGEKNRRVTSLSSSSSSSPRNSSKAVTIAATQQEQEQERKPMRRQRGE